MRRYITKLNRFAIPLVVAVALFLCFVSPLTASAGYSDAYDFTSMPYSVELGADFNYVHFAWPSSHCVWTICTTREPNVIVGRALGSGSIDFTFKAGESYLIRCYPFSTVGFSLDTIPDGTSIGMAASFNAEVASGTTEFDSIPSVSIYGWLKDSNYKSSSRELYDTFTLDSFSEPFSVVMSVNSDVLFSKVAADPNSIYNRFIPMIAIDNFVASYSTDKTVHLSFTPATLVMKMPSSYWVQFQNDVLDSKLERTFTELETLQESYAGIRDDLAVLNENVLLTYDAIDHFYDHWNTWQFNFTGWVWDAFEGVENAITASETSINNNVDLAKVEILNAIADMNNSIVAGTPEMDSIAQDSNQNLSNSSNKLDSLGDQLAAVEKPNVEDIQPSSPQDIVTDPNAGVLLSAPITSMWENKVIFGIVSTVLTLVLLSWVFFGKK